MNLKEMKEKLNKGSHVVMSKEPVGSIGIIKKEKDGFCLEAQGEYGNGIANIKLEGLDLENLNDKCFYIGEF